MFIPLMALKETAALTVHVRGLYRRSVRNGVLLGQLYCDTSHNACLSHNTFCNVCIYLDGAKK